MDYVMEQEREVDFDQEEKLDRILRPKYFEDFVGQKDLIAKLSIAIEAAKERDDPVPHILLASSNTGGVGKSTIAELISNEYGTKCKTVVASAIKSKSDIIETFVKAERNSCIHLEECHSLNITLQECLYSAMQEYKITVKLGHDKLSHIDIEQFCLIGTTTSIGKLSEPFVSRFGIIHNMGDYTEDEIKIIIEANAQKLSLKFDSEELFYDLSRRSRGIPRLANRLLHRLRDYCQIKNNGMVDEESLNAAMDLEGVDSQGFTQLDYKYLDSLFSAFNCNPAGLNSIAATMNEAKETIEHSVEPFLLKNGLIVKTKSGRTLSSDGLDFVLEKKKLKQQ